MVTHQQAATAMEFHVRDALWLMHEAWADKMVSDGDGRGSPGAGSESLVYIWWGRRPRMCGQCGQREEPCRPGCNRCFDLCECGMEDCVEEDFAGEESLDVGAGADDKRPRT